MDTDHLPFILSDDASIEKGIAAGGDDYLLKPISEIVLGAKIRAMQRLVLMRSSLLALTRKLDAANQELVRISSSDGLTGVANRRFFDETMALNGGGAPALEQHRHAHVRRRFFQTVQ